MHLASVLRYQGKHEQAEEIHRQTLKLRERVLGKEHPDTLTSMNNLALMLNDQSKDEQAEEMHRRTLELRERVLGKEHPDADEHGPSGLSAEPSGQVRTRKV
jgi:Tetratricopeptide repeat